MFKLFLLTFIPIFVAIDAIGTIPIFLVFTSNLDRKVVKSVIIKSILVSFVICFVFIFIGKYILDFLNITISDFTIAGGVLLFILSIKSLLETKEESYKYDEGFSIVPLATPLIVGPALLTTLLILELRYSIILIVLSTILNLIIAGFLFLYANSLIKIFGEHGIRGLAKISSLFLASIGVMFVRVGIKEIFFNY